MQVPTERENAREDRIDPMWSADEDERRLAIYRRAAAGARKTLTLKQ
ncbi:hypothetical protein [Devosia psychrophila]|jgi:hypothetical protein|uniref:Uncharacterized protein n=1 Tax=Devosia psychrophila TaxID=728005 RepID=A0A1I1JFZ1_9HYPH|nr:hypothetical protein [Devosia psychrophila]SFC47071.1 hypothetical protein SAMN04488059_105185 [Devosia psychrophila]